MILVNIHLKSYFPVICMYFLISEAENTNIKHDKSTREFSVYQDVGFSADFKLGIINAGGNFISLHTECNCGKNSVNCSVINGMKICICESGYVPGEYQTCTPMCNDTHTCNNGGSCYNELCMCLPGTSGPFCDTIDGCSDLKCENDKNANCSYDQKDFKAYCKCQKWDNVFDYDDNTCKECKCDTCEQKFCLSGAVKCEFIRSKKTCVCKAGYKFNPKTGTCEFCYCGDKDKVKSCDFDKDGNTMCQCERSYQQQGKKSGICTKCDCGKGDCKFDDNERVCSCFSGYSEWIEYCQECDCGVHGKCEFADYLRKTRCICDPGYTEISGKCQLEKECYCGENALCKIIDDEKKCDCFEGFQNVNGICTDINECDNPKICSQNMKCINTIGSYECVCRKGFNRIDQQSGNCEDIDECLNDTSCLSSETECFNTIGSFKCVCKPGYVTQMDTGSTILCEGKSGWKLGYGVLIGVFIASYIGLLIIVYKRYRQ